MKRALLALAIVSVAVISVVSWSLARQVWWVQPAAGAPELSFVVEPNMGAEVISQRLRDAGVIKGDALFNMYVRTTGVARSLKAGTFMLKAGMSIASVAKILTEASASDRRITMLEGWGIREMGEYLVAQGALKSADEWYAVVGTPPSVAGAGRQIPGTLSRPGLPEAVTLEGYLFPDTYRFATDATAEDIAKKMLENFDRRTREFGAVGNDALILASIVEREVRSDADRKMVADLFLRRLKEGMALQADSTVNYVTGKKTPSLSLADRDIDSPWNTYQHRGLPPTPISNPSLSAITAVLNPTPNPYVYFLTDAEGTVHYARTFEEHVANKSRYLR